MQGGRSELLWFDWLLHNLEIILADCSLLKTLPVKLMLDKELKLGLYLNAK